MSKAHRVEELEPGKWRYSDGSIRNASGHWIKQPPGSAPLITGETSHDMIARKVDKSLAKKEELQEELERAYKKALNTRTGKQALAKVGGKLLERAHSDKEPLQACTQTFKTLASAAGMLHDRTTAPTQAVQINISLEAAEALRSYGVEFVESEES